MKMTFLERTIAVFAPMRAARMATARQIRGYDGAKKGRRLGAWGSAIKNANQDISNDRDTLIARSRDLEQNDPWAKGGYDALVANMIGEGIIPTPIIFNETDDTPQKQITKQEQFDALVTDWADTTNCDFMDQTNLYGMQGLTFRTITKSGMCFVIREKDPENPSLPLRLKVLEPDFLDMRKNSETDSLVTFRGIEISKKTKRVTAYWLLQEHPDGGISSLGSNENESIRYPIEEVSAPFMPLRPGQLVGVPWLYAGMTRLYEFSKYEDAQLMKQQVSALTVSYITRESADDTDEAEQDKYYETREPGGHIYLNPGESVSEANPPSVDGYAEFSKNALRAVARVFGITYEELTQDYSNVNFSSARMGWVGMNRNIKMWRAHMFNPMFLDKVGRWMIEAATVRLGDLSFIRMSWTPPRREMIDPSRELSANAVGIQTGQLNLTEIYAETGRDFKRAMLQRKREIDLLNKLGLKIEGVNLNINISTGEDSNATQANAA